MSCARGWCWRQRRQYVLLAMLAVWLVCCVLLVRRSGPLLPAARRPRKLCRPDIAVNALPEMAEDGSQMIRDLFTYLTKPNRRACGKVLRFGGLDNFWLTKSHEGIVTDGQKYVCLDPDLGILTTEDCLVYSIGISNDWQFDDAMDWFGCHVHAFDPSINYTSVPEDGNIKFLKYGIGSINNVTDNGWNIRTLESLVAKLGHTGRVIHYLKMDVESNEWLVLQQQAKLMHDSTLFRSVEQLGIELHFTKIKTIENVAWYRELYRSLIHLQEMGFYPFSYEPNMITGLKLDLPDGIEDVVWAMEVVWRKTDCIGI